MKLNLKIKQSNDILCLDIFQWILNLFRGPDKLLCYTSKLYGISTFRLSDYWVELGKKEILIELLKSKQKGIRSLTLEELAVKVAVLEYGNSTVLVIYNFDMSAIGKIVDRLPGIDPNLFKQDVVFIPCTTLDQARKIKSRLPEDIAYSLIVDNSIGYV